MDFNQYVKGNALRVSNTTINISKLVSFLQNNAQIKKLSLPYCNISDEDARELAKLTNLTSLNLEGNKIGKRGAEALANGNLANLISLDLRWNGIGKKGAEALANGNLTHLTKLDLWNNNIDDKGAEALANGNLANLISLNLRWNRIGKKGIEALANGNLINLNELDLRWNGNSEKDAGLAVKHILTSLKKRHIEEKLKEESQSRVKEMEERHQAELTRLRKENQSRIKEIEERHQTEMTALRGKSHPGSKLNKVQPISRDQSMSSSHSDDSDIEIISRSQCC
ncbi:MAG: hypothetical protein LBU02_00025 [Rickettsiales bacterium]|nr:hypothetical protein [Rickettsiales bacterium]